MFDINRVKGKLEEAWVKAQFEAKTAIEYARDHVYLYKWYRANKVKEIKDREETEKLRDLLLASTSLSRELTVRPDINVTKGKDQIHFADDLPYDDGLDPWEYNDGKTSYRIETLIDPFGSFEVKNLRRGPVPDVEGGGGPELVQKINERNKRLKEEQNESEEGAKG